MNSKYRFIPLILLIFLISPVAADTWADGTFNYRSYTPIADGIRPYQPSLNLSNAVGTNNDTYLYCNGHCNSNFSDIKFYLNNATLLNHYLDNTSTGYVVYVNLTANGSVSMYYGKSTAASLSNGTNTFPFFEDFSGDLSKWTLNKTSGGSATIVNGELVLTDGLGTDWTTPIKLSATLPAATNGYFFSGQMKTTTFGSGMNNIGFNLTDTAPSLNARTDMTPQYIFYRNTTSTTVTSPAPQTNVYDTFQFWFDGTTYNYKIVERAVSGSGSHSTKPNIIVLGSAEAGSTPPVGVFDNIKVQQYTSVSAPKWATWGAEEAYLISSYGNNYTNDNTLNFSIVGSTYINFNFTNTSRYERSSWFFNGVNQSNGFNNITLYVNSTGVNNITAYAFNGTNTSSVTWFVTLPFTLLAPANGSTINESYPPLDTPVNFSWNSVGYPYYELVISRTSSFSLIVSDTYTTETSKNVSLSTGQYWWKVRNYNPTTESWGEYSPTFNFNISLSSTASGLGIDGVIYELINGVYTPIPEATVYAYNNTHSYSMTTGSNGYYLFSGLANGTYNIYASKQGYETTAVFPVTVNGSVTTNDILMKIYISPYVPNFVFEKFIVRDLFDRSYVGVTATVYKGDSPISSFTGTTDSTGSVVFQLIKDQRYRVTFSGGGISGTITVYVYAKEESFFVRVLTGFPTGGDRYTDISTNLTAVTINSTHSYLQLIYNDTRASTTALNFYATNLSTNVTCTNTSVSNVVTLACTVVASGTYQFGFNATSSIYGFFQEDKIINFDVGKPSAPAVDTTVNSDLLQWASIILIVITAALFSVRTVKYGAVIVPLEALALWAFGWFEPIANNIAGSFLLLSCAVVLGVMIYLRGSEIKVNY